MYNALYNVIERPEKLVEHASTEERCFDTSGSSLVLAKESGDLSKYN